MGIAQSDKPAGLCFHTVTFLDTQRPTAVVLPEGLLLDQGNIFTHPPAPLAVPLRLRRRPHTGALNQSLLLLPLRWRGHFCCIDQKGILFFVDKAAAPGSEPLSRGAAAGRRVTSIGRGAGFDDQSKAQQFKVNQKITQTLW